MVPKSCEVGLPVNGFLGPEGKFPFNGMVRRRTLEVVECGQEAFHETSGAGH